MKKIQKPLVTPPRKPHKPVLGGLGGWVTKHFQILKEGVE